MCSAEKIIAGVNYEKPLGYLMKVANTDYKIVVPNNSLMVEDFAASELKNYVAKITSYPMSIVKDSDLDIKLGDKFISIGETRLAVEANLDTTGLNYDGFKIKTVGQTLFIKGETGRATLYGVYDFLEKFLGVRFLTQDVEYVPENFTIRLYETDITEIPDFRLRSHMSGTFGKDLAFNSKMRLLNPFGHGDFSKYGGSWKEEWSAGGNMHSYNVYLPRHIHEKAHPDWYTIARNPSYSEEGQFHLSHGLNDDGTIDDTKEGSLIKAVIEEIKKRILENEHITYIALGQNDNDDYCRGEGCNGACLRQRELFGGHAAHTIVWANAIAREIGKWSKEQNLGRDFQFVVFAYWYTQDAPDLNAPLAKLAVPDKNVCIELCPYNAANHNSPIKDEKNNPYFYDLFESWRKVTNNYFIFDYVRDFCHYLAWYPNLNVFKPNLQYYKEIGAIGVQNCGENGGYHDRLMQWLSSKLLWKIDQDQNALISEFNYYVYGEAAGRVIDEWVAYNNDYFEEVAKKPDGTRAYLPCYGREGIDYHLSPSTLNEEYLSKSYALVEKARVLILQDKTCSDQLRRQRLKNLLLVEVQIDYMQHVNYDYSLRKKSEEEKLEFYRNFQSKLFVLGMTKMANNPKYTDKVCYPYQK